MRRRLVYDVASAWKARSLGGVRHSHEFLERQLKLKQPHELKNATQYGWKEYPTSWPVQVAFGALAVAVAGVVVYEADRYFKLRPSAKRILDANTFLPFTLSSRDPVSSTCTIFTLRPTNSQLSVGDPFDLMWRNPVWSVEAKQPQLQIARSYTPLPPTKPYVASDPDACALRFLIREEEKGEMSGYLHRLGVGAEVELRGPRLESQIPRDADEILFFAGGTGIAPALQVAHYLSQIPPGSGKVPRLHIIWSSRRREDCRGGTDDTPKPSRSGGGFINIFSGQKSGRPVPGHLQSPMVRELERLKSIYPGRLKVDYFVDEEKSFVDAAAVRSFVIDNASSNPEAIRKAVMVSGPDGFVAYMAGPKEWKNGHQQQGQLGGLLQEVMKPEWTVLKL